jgi:hypothetical protein
MSDAAMLRRKAAELLKNAASAETPASAADLEELGRQLEVWADELELETADQTDSRTSSKSG